MKPGALALPLVGPAEAAPGALSRGRAPVDGHRRGQPDAIRPPRTSERSGEAVSAQAQGAVDVAALYRRYGDMVYGRCLTLLRNDADAIEATQEVFLKAFRNADRFEGRSKPSTWLYRIATNHCLNVIRSRKRHPEDPVEEIQDHVPPPPAGGFPGDSVLDAVAGAQLVAVLLADCDERTQQCVVYHYLDGMTHDEVGALLGISGAAVRKRLAKFRAESQARLPTWAGWSNPLTLGLPDPEEEAP